MNRWMTRGHVMRAAAGGAALVLLCAAMARPVARDEAPPPTLTPLVTLTGAHSHVTEARCVRITSQEAWAALWLEHLGEPAKANYNFYFNKAGLPVVDFSRCMVIAVFAGTTENSAGYEAMPAAPATGGASTDPGGSPAAREPAAGEAVLRIVDHSFQTAGPDPEGGAQHVTPFGFFIVPRTLAPLVVQEFEGGPGGGSGRVTERRRFPALPDVLPAPAPEPIDRR